jgi:hypothetical protein
VSIEELLRLTVDCPALVEDLGQGLCQSCQGSAGQIPETVDYAGGLVPAKLSSKLTGTSSSARAS